MKMQCHGRIPDQRAELRRMLDRAGARLPARHRDAALARLEALSAGTAVCHGELHPGNVMMVGARGDVARTSFLAATPRCPVTRRATGER